MGIRSAIVRGVRSIAIGAARAVAWAIDLGGLPLDRRVRKVLEAQRKTFEDLGCIVEDACPDFGNVNEIFLTLRTWASWTTYKDLLAQHRSQFKPDAVWDIESGAHVTGEELGRALDAAGSVDGADARVPARSTTSSSAR